MNINILNEPDINKYVYFVGLRRHGAEKWVKNRHNNEQPDSNVHVKKSSETFNYMVGTQKIQNKSLTDIRLI
jgi:hypothetical protein